MNGQVMGQLDWLGVGKQHFQLEDSSGVIELYDRGVHNLGKSRRVKGIYKLSSSPVSDGDWCYQVHGPNTPI